MPDLQSLEAIAQQLSTIFGRNISSVPVPNLQTYSDMTVDEIKQELHTIHEESKEKSDYIRDEVEALKNYAEKPPELSVKSIEDITQIITGINEAQGHMDDLKEKSNELHEIYKEKQLSDAGFVSYAHVINVREQLQEEKKQKRAESKDLRKNVFSRIRNRKTIRDNQDIIDNLNTRISSLFHLELENYDESYISMPDYFVIKSFESTQGKLFEDLAMQLFSHYKTIAENLAAKEKRYDPLPQGVLDTLKEEYIDTYFSSKIQQKIEENRSYNSFDSMKIASALSDPSIIEKARALFEEGLYTSLHSDTNFMDLDGDAPESLSDKITSLPRAIHELFNYNPLIKGKISIDTLFSTMGYYVTQTPLELSRSDLAKSVSASKQKILRSISGDDLPYDITRKSWDIKEAAENIEKSITALDTVEYMQALDLDLWEMFRNNPSVREFYGSEKLDAFHQDIGHDIFQRLLVTPEHTESSIQLGHNALLFQYSEIIPYNILNFWRESGYSGEAPFLFAEHRPQNTPAYKYMKSLSVEQLAEVEHMGIPGLTQIINSVRNNPKTFRDRNIEDGEKKVPNPAYDAIQEGLGKVCNYYLKHGSEEEKYFTLSVIADLDFMSLSNYDSDQRDITIANLSQLIGLNENAQSNFKKHYMMFTKQLESESKQSHNFRGYRRNLSILSEYKDDLENTLENSLHPDKVLEEASKLEKDGNYIFNFSKDLPALISYLKGYDAQIVQTALKDEEYGDFFETRLYNIKESIFRNDKERIENITDYTVSGMQDLHNIIVSTKKQIAGSAVESLLESEFKRILSDILLVNPEGEPYISAYMNALDDEDTAERFDWFDDRRKKSIAALAWETYDTGLDFFVPLIRTTIAKEKSPHRMGLLQKGVRTVYSNDVLSNHILELFKEQPGKAYHLLSDISVVHQLLNDHFFENISSTSNTASSLKDYNIEDKVLKLAEEKGLETDNDITTYTRLLCTQEKKNVGKKIQYLIKLKDQISRFEDELNQHPDNEILEKKINERKDKVYQSIQNEKTSAIYHFMHTTFSDALETIVGEQVKVNNIDDDMINAVLTYSSINVNKGLLSDIIKKSLHDQETSMYSDEKNQEAIEKYASMGINTQKWIQGIERTYTPNKVESVLAEKEIQIKHHTDDALQIFSNYGFKATKENMYETFRKFRERDDIDEEVKRDLKTQLNAIKSIENQAYNSKIGDVTLSIENDPLKVLQMGNVVSNSCLGLGKGNTYSTVANAVDSNKQVIYARMNGEIIGRKLIALNDVGEIVQFRTYNNRLDLNMDELFSKYLKDFSNETNAKLGYGGTVSTIRADKWYNDGIISNP